MSFILIYKTGLDLNFNSPNLLVLRPRKPEALVEKNQQSEWFYILTKQPKCRQAELHVIVLDSKFSAFRPSFKHYLFK